jgi:hypothetical protein
MIVHVGDVVHVSVLGQSLVILNSVEAVSDLLDARSQIYSDRPFFTMVGELMGVGDVSSILLCSVQYVSLTLPMHSSWY